MVHRLGSPAGGRSSHRSPMPPSNLPAQPTSLIGRDTLIEAVAVHLREPSVRLITLTGVGGTGKTRLALAVAERLLPAFPDGVFLVDLQPVRDPARVMPAIAAVLGVVETSGRSPAESVAQFLRARATLLLLDNFEQVLPAAAEVAALLAACARLKVLVTSRAPLRVRWEHETAVPPLLVPRSAVQVQGTTAELEQVDSIRLFVERARAVRADFAVTEQNAPAVADICTRLEGLPLAIELAAARVNLLSPAALLARLQHRLSVLTTGARDAPARQQTLRDAIAWSYDLLTPGHQRLFRRLAVFAGGCTVDAVETVCDEPDAFDGLVSLVDNSLLAGVSLEGADVEPRFRMLETVRELALEQLAVHGDEQETRCRHARYYCSLAEQAEPELRGPHQMVWLARLEAEHDNLRVALAWSLDGARDPAVGPRLATALWWFWHLHGYYSEGRRWVERLLERAAPGGGAAQRAALLLAAGALARFHGDFAAARPRLEESVMLFRALGDRLRLAEALHWLGRAVWDQGDFEIPGGLFAESLDLFESLRDAWGAALARCTIASVVAAPDDPAVRPQMELTLATFRRLGDRWGIARTLGYLGQHATATGDYARAAPLLEEYVAVSRALGNMRFVSYGLRYLGEMALRQREYDRAACWFMEGLAVARDLDETALTAWCLVGLALVCAATEQPGEAARLLGAAEALRQTVRAGLSTLTGPLYEQLVAAVRAALGDEGFAAAWAAGRSMTLDEAVAVALQTQEAEATDEALASAALLPSDVAAASGLPDGLTRREVEVLRLVAAGLSNRAIADALVISVRTAERHIANIYEKIGAHDKTARATATAYAFHHGFVTADR